MKKYPIIFFGFFQKIQIFHKYFLGFWKNKNNSKIFSHFSKKYFWENNIFSTLNRENIFFYIFSAKMKKYFQIIFSMGSNLPTHGPDGKILENPPSNRLFFYLQVSARDAWTEREIGEKSAQKFFEWLVFTVALIVRVW